MAEIKIVDHLPGVGTLTIDCPANWDVWVAEDDHIRISRLGNPKGEYAPRMEIEVSLVEGKMSVSELEKRVAATSQNYNAEVVGPASVESEDRTYSVVQIIWHAEDEENACFGQHQGIAFPHGEDTVLVLAQFITPTSDPENPVAQELREILGTLARVVTSADDQPSAFL